MSSSLNLGALCVIIGGCPENIGLIVEAIKHIGPYHLRTDAYEVRTVSGRAFHQLWNSNGELIRGHSNVCITSRHKLRPLVDQKDKFEVCNIAGKRVGGKERKLTACHS